MTKLRIALAQATATLFNKRANLDKAQEILREAADQGADVAIFPELYLTGYLLGERVLEVAETLDSPSVERMSAWAKEYRLSVQMGFAELTEDGKSAYDAVFYVDQTGRVLGSYRKIHLFGVEHTTFRAGDSPCLFENGIAPQICSDVEFPELARIQALEGARLLTISSSVPQPFEGVQELHARAHALANHVFVAWTNRSGTERELTFTGGSLLADPLGQILAQAGSEESLLVAELDFSCIAEARDFLAYDYLKERRPALYRRLVDH